MSARQAGQGLTDLQDDELALLLGGQDLEGLGLVAGGDDAVRHLREGGREHP